MSTNSAQKLETALLAKGLITQAQADEITRAGLTTGKSTLEIIKEHQFVPDLELVKVIGEISGIPFADPKEYDIKPEVIELIPEKIAKKYVLIPVSMDSYAMKVVMKDPFDLDVIQYLERITKKTIQPSISTEDIINQSIEKEYSKSLGEDVSEAIEKAAETSTQKIQENLSSIEQADQIIKVSPVAKIVGVILEYAVKVGASDIHIEAQENKTRIRYRIDGVLTEKFPLPKSIHDSIIARIKILANMPIDEKRKPLDGKFRVEVGDRKTDLRVSTLPTVHGEKCVIRLLKADNQVLTLDQLGLWGEGLKHFNDALSQTTGILLVTGPTGSGKTVTLATSLAKLNSPKVNIVTLEDPVEISIPGVNQVQVNPQAGLTFASGLRSILRQDPNIIMVGEIRDVETARLAIQSALTGHLVLATLHTNSSAGAIPRLLDMGVEPFLLSSTMNVALAQRLTRKICPFCRERYEADEVVVADIQKVLGDRLMKIAMGEPQIKVKWEGDTKASEKPKEEGKIYLYRGKGCKECNNEGYKGRIGIYEIMKVSAAIQKLTESAASADLIEKTAKEEGLISLVQDGYIKALWGITTIQEVLTVADENDLS